MLRVRKKSRKHLTLTARLIHNRSLGLLRRKTHRSGTGIKPEVPVGEIGKVGEGMAHVFFFRQFFWEPLGLFVLYFILSRRQASRTPRRNR